MESPKKLLPALFIAHGSPMNIIANNDFTKSISSYAEKIKPHIKSILCISAHWQSEGVKVTGANRLETIYDFSGFPEELSQIKYNPIGNEGLTNEVYSLLKDFKPEIDKKRGIDHGAWSVLHHMFPKADIPYVQLSCNLDFRTSEHYAMAKQLAPLREKGVLIIGSGNIVHSFYAYDAEDKTPPPDWAVEFDDKIKEALLKNDHETIIRYRRIFGKIGKVSVPTEDHYIPFLYAIGVQKPDEKIKFIYEGFQNGAMSMRSFEVDKE